ncbi:MAG: arylamine N-acetyltransferase [Oleiphilaceae bacterium]|jgi:arylamine N-acetyltransferase
MSHGELQNLLKSLKLRIEVPEASIASLDELEILRSAFSVSVPYENLSVLRDASISIDTLDVLNKFSKKRGGYCFELNTAFGALLKGYGLSPKMHLGRVWLRNPEQVPPRNHGTNVIEFGGRQYIADVGFGARAPRCLIPLFDFGVEIDDGDALNEPVRIIKDCHFGVMIQRRIGGVWANQYSLELEPAYRSDIEAANHFQASPLTSHFRQHLFVGRFTAEGRDGLFDNRLTQRAGLDTKVHIITSLSEIRNVLESVFDIDARGYDQVLKAVVDRTA